MSCLNLQNLGDSELPYLVTFDPPHTPEHTLVKWRTSRPLPSIAASKASRELHQIQGKRGIWFSGAYQGMDFFFMQSIESFLKSKIDVPL